LIAQPHLLQPRNLLLLLLTFALIWFGNLEYRKLVRPDEGRYAEIPREMVATGDWLTPRLNGIKYFEKPPLQYWATAGAYTLFGEHQWSARLWPALSGFLGVLLVGFGATRLFGAEAGAYAALVLASSLLYVLIAHVNTLDMGVTVLMTGGLVGFLLAQRAQVSAAENRRWMLLAWAMLALAVLSKGLMGLVLPAATLTLYIIVQRDWALLRRLHLGKGIALFLLIAAPWFIWVSIANPEFARFFFVHEHVERFLTTTHRRDQPAWYFIPILLAGTLPWTVTMLDALARAWPPAAPAAAFQPRRFLLIWTVFIYLFFSVSSSKLPSYILPIFPALALLAGERITTMPARLLFKQLIAVALVALACLLLAPFTVRLASDEVPYALYAAYSHWLIAAAAVLTAGSALALYCALRQRVATAVVGLALSGLIAAQLALTGHEALAPASSSYYLVRTIQPYLKPGVPFYSVGTYEQTLPFYIKRPVTLVAFLDEMEFGVRQEPQRWLPDLDSFERAWRSHDYALAIMDKDMYRKLAQSGLPMQVIAQDTRRIVVKTL
jgi:4-amino-4-deoxy-L-arabinose transferase-like glycosyltransferase